MTTVPQSSFLHDFVAPKNSRAFGIWFLSSSLLLKVSHVGTNYCCMDFGEETTTERTCHPRVSYLGDKLLTVDVNFDYFYLILLL